MKKTVKNLVTLLELYREHPYRELIARLSYDGWIECLFFEEKVAYHSHVKFLGMFSNGWFQKPVEVAVFTIPFKGDEHYCFLKLGDQIYKVNPTMELE